MIVFVIDVSSSMFGQRIEAIKVNCIKNMASFKQENPNLKIALITFSSTATFYGDGSVEIQIKEIENHGLFQFFLFKNFEFKINNVCFFQ